MKFIIKQILIILFLISIISKCQCGREERKYRLSHLVTKLNDEKNSQDEENKISKFTDIDCVKDYFKLPQNDKMIVGELESKVLTVAALLKCSDEEKVQDYYIDTLIFDGLAENVDCLKYYLKELEPASKLVENFEISEDDIELCESKFRRNIFRRIIRYIEYDLGPLNEFTCGAVLGANDYAKFITKAVTIKYDSISQELKVAEMKLLKEYFKEITLTTVNCIMKRFEDDPAAFLAYNTLNYFYIEAIKSIKVEDHITKKVEADIDQSCVKQKLNLPENGAKTLIKVEATLIIAAAKARCITVDKTIFLDDFLKYAIPKNELSDQIVTCAKYKLHKIEPTSKLAKLSKNDQDYEKYCDYSDRQTYPYTILKYNIGSGANLNKSTCGVFTEQDVEVNKYKTILLANETDEELKKSEGEALLADVTDKLQRLSDCILA
ncbi:hypothetical protein ACKWTF_014870 [Chironomus riparius]